MPHEYRDDGRNSYRGGRGPNRGGGRGQGGGYGGGGEGYGQGGRGGERRGIPLSDLDPKITEASRRVIGCAIEVHKSMGPGYDAATYLAALKVELEVQGVPYKHDHVIPVTYKDKKVGETVACLFVDGLFLVSVISRAGEVGTTPRMALRSQLKAAGLDLGLIVNFAERRLKDGLVRVLNIEKINADKGVLSHDGLEDDHHDGSDPHDRMADFDGQA